MRLLRVYWNASILRATPAHVAHISREAASKARGLGGVASLSQRQRVPLSRTGSVRTLECPFHNAEARSWSRVCVWSCPEATPAACLPQTTREHAQDTVQCVTRRFDEGI